MTANPPQLAHNLPNPKPARGDGLGYWVWLPFRWLHEMGHNGLGIVRVLDITKYRPLPHGLVGPDHIVGELGEVLIGRVPGRSSSDEITVFKSLGLAIEDVACAHFLYERRTSDGVSV